MEEFFSIKVNEMNLLLIICLICADIIPIDGRSKYLLVKTRDKNYVFTSKNLVKDLDDLENGLSQNQREDSQLGQESQDQSGKDAQNSRPGDFKF